MKFDLSSFLLGCGVGATSMLLGRYLRPALLGGATFFYRLQGRVMAGTPMGRDALAALLAEARARASLPFHSLSHSRVHHPSPAGRGTG